MRRDERGAALIAALMALATLAILAAGTATLGMGATRSSSYWKNRIAALYVAESGINEAIYRLDQMQPAPRRAYPADEPSFTSAAGLLDDASSYQVWVEDIDANQVMVTARGTRDGVNRVVRVVIGLASSTSCLFHDPDEDGIIELSETPPPARICPEIDVVVEIPPPPGTIPGPSSRIRKKDGPQTLPPGSYAYTDGLRLDQEAQLTIEGPATLYITGNLKMDNSARLIVRGEVTFHVGDAVSFGQNARLTDDGTTTFHVGESFEAKKSAQLGSDPTRLTVFMSTETDPEVILKHGAVFNGGIYAPTGEVTLMNSAHLNGAVVGNTVAVNQDATVTYDPRLADGSEGGGEEGLSVVRGSWGEM